MQRNITGIEQFVSMKNSDRRALVRTLSDEEYEDVMAMCAMLPHMAIEAETQGGCNHICVCMYMCVHVYVCTCVVVMLSF